MPLTFPLTKNTRSKSFLFILNSYKYILPTNLYLIKINKKALPADITPANRAS